jgi:hypothetical protein
MSVVKWQFQESPVGIRENEQIGEEFFSNAEVLSEVSGVVRESIQNSLDEVFDNSKPIHMVFTVGRQSPDVANRYFEELHPHLAAIAMRELPNFEEQSQFLVIEDFNTRGLEGPTTPNAPTKQQLMASESTYKHSFWFFEWKTGASPKGAGNRGSWGVGKIVFPRASRIKSYLVLSVRRPEAAPNNDTSIMFGHSILKTRELNGKRYVPDCQWMTKDQHGNSVPGFESSAQQLFINDWMLYRKPGELGTSIVVPFCRESMNVKNLVQSIIRDYFISILGGQLVCTVRDDAGAQIEINKDTIVDLIEEEINDENMPRRSRSAAELKDLSEMYLAHESEGTVSVVVPINTGSPNDWKEIAFSETDAERITQAYNSGRIIELSVETLVPEMLTTPTKDQSKDKFTVLLKKAMDMRGSTVFCREGILIPAANTSSVLQNCVSMVIVGSMSSAGAVENSIANLLKNAEGPSHEKWSPDATNFKGLYKPKKAADAAIRWVKYSAEKCLRLIQGAENIEDDATLSPYFPFSEDDGNEPGTAKVVLLGQRDPGDPDAAILVWRADGFLPQSWVLQQLEPIANDIDSGTASKGKTTISLDSGRSVVYRFQMVMNNAGKEIKSNVVVIRPEVTDPPPPPTQAKIEIQKLSTGFAIVAQNGEKLPARYRFKVRAQYVARGGKASWTSEDFLLNDHMDNGKTNGLKIIRSAENYCELEVTDSDFYAEWRGFDRLRDLDVTATEVI